VALRDEQIKLSIARIKPRLDPYPEGKTRSEPIAVVGYGPSLKDSWPKIKDYKYVMTCSGAHKFLIDKGIIPTHHVEVDPRAHKTVLQGQPHKDVIYYISSTCHPAVFDHLEGYDVRLWHVFDAELDAMRMLPAGEWAVTGGPSVGLRAMTIARFLGFTYQNVFGMDGCAAETAHAAEHIVLDKVTAFSTTTYCDVSGCSLKGTVYKTSKSMLSVAQGTWHELDQMVDVKATFHGEGLVQHMAMHYKRTPMAKGKSLLGFEKPVLISPEQLELTKKLHYDQLGYGIGAGEYADLINNILAGMPKGSSLLDYGCGKGYLAKSLQIPIWEYDPAIEGKTESPRPADVVCVINVLEYVERDKLAYVLADLARCILQVGFFVIHMGVAGKTLANGENAHLIQHRGKWWEKVLREFFTVAKIITNGSQVRIVVGPRGKALRQTFSVRTAA